MYIHIIRRLSFGWRVTMSLGGNAKLIWEWRASLKIVEVLWFRTSQNRFVSSHEISMAWMEWW
jgi:hypothetical protein